VVDEQLRPPLLASSFGACGRPIDPQAAPLLDERGNVLALPQPAEAEELLSVQLQASALPRFQRSRPGAIALDLGFDEMLLVGKGKVGTNGSSPSRSDGLNDGLRLRRSSGRGCRAAG
jgi:hypothetical protein